MAAQQCRLSCTAAQPALPAAVVSARAASLLLPVRARAAHLHAAALLLCVRWVHDGAVERSQDIWVGQAHHDLSLLQHARQRLAAQRSGAEQLASSSGGATQVV